MKESVETRAAHLLKAYPKLQKTSAETLGWIMDRLRVTVEGTKNLEETADYVADGRGGAVVIANHESIADYLLFRLVRRHVPENITVVAPWAEKFLNGEMGPWGMIGQALGALDKIDLISIPQTASSENIRRLAGAITDMGTAVENGAVVCFFPQGTRSRTVGMIEARSGMVNKLFGKETVRQQTLILPVAIAGTRGIHEPNSHRVNPLAKVRITAGKPFFYAQAEAEAAKNGVRVTDIMMWRIGQMLPAEYEGEYREIFAKIRAGSFGEGD